MSDLPTAGLGIDIGTTGLRMSLVKSKPIGRAGGRVEDKARALEHIEVHAALPAGRREGDRHEQDPADWWRALECCLDQLAGLTDLQSSIRALAIDGTSGTILLCDAEGTPLTPGVMYDDRRADVEAKTLSPFRSSGTLAHTAASPLAKALWLLRNLDRTHPETVLLSHQADWLAGRITGKFGATDENNALKTGYDPVARAWPFWINATGCSKEVLPVVHPVGTTLGRVSAGFARRFGFNPECRVLLGTTDSVAAFLATPAEQIGDAVTSWGTTLAIKLLVPRPAVDNDSGIYSHRLGDRWLVGGASNVGGSILLEHFQAEEIEHLSGKIAPDRPTGLAYYPLIKPGERFPVCDPTCQPCLEPRPKEKHLFLQAIFEGMAEVERLAYSKLESLAGIGPQIIYSTGGVTRNRAFNAIRARVLKSPIVLSEHTDASFGMARLALRSLQ